MLDIKKLYKHMNDITEASKKLKKPLLTDDIVKTGLRVSNQALTSKLEVNLTPYTANMLHELDGIDQLDPSDSVTKMEEYLEKATRKLLIKYVGKEKLHYDLQGDPTSFDNYVVDCWRNFKPGTGLRHIVPNMNAKREENFAKFYVPMKPLKLDLTDPIWLKTLALMDKLVPTARLSPTWVEVNLPFMNKHTNVGYPYFRNDKNLVPGKTITYGNLVDEEARKLTPKMVANFPYIAFGRNQRGKSRAILAGSRLQALVFNQLESMEIQAYKASSPLFIGYRDPDGFKEKMVTLGKFLIQHKHLSCMNRDYSAFDTTVNPVLRQLNGAISIEKAIGAKAKEIAFWRAVATQRSLLFNGLTKSIKPIYGRIFSGEIDTNAAGGKINALADLYALNSLVPDYSSEIFEPVLRAGTSPIWVMGDDNLLVQPKDMNNERYSKLVNREFGLNVSHEKGEYGLFFLQRRVFYRDGKWTMVTPFTRVIRGLANKESRKGLGPAGWTLASYMLLEQLIEWPELMVDVAKIFAPYDKYRFGTVWSVKQLTKLVAEEDITSRQDKGRRAKTTAQILYDGDPLKQKWFTPDGQLKESNITKIHSLLSKGLQRM